MEELRRLAADRLERWQKLCEEDPDFAWRCAEEYRVSYLCGTWDSSVHPASQYTGRASQLEQVVTRKLFLGHVVLGV